jgi:predicted  nucleic acid-binding Zn-ribbon protein
MARDNAPVPHTCPKIDQVISFLEKIDWDLSDDDEKDLSIECKEMVEVMEEIRKVNDSLRSWGNELHDDLEKLEETSQSEYIELENKNRDLVSEINSLKSKIQKLENELSTTYV